MRRVVIGLAHVAIWLGVAIVAGIVAGLIEPHVPQIVARIGPIPAVTAIMLGILVPFLLLAKLAFRLFRVPPLQD